MRGKKDKPDDLLRGLAASLEGKAPGQARLEHSQTAGWQMSDYRSKVPRRAARMMEIAQRLANLNSEGEQRLLGQGLSAQFVQFMRQAARHYVEQGTAERHKGGRE